MNSSLSSPIPHSISCCSTSSASPFYMLSYATSPASVMLTTTEAPPWSLSSSCSKSWPTPKFSATSYTSAPSSSPADPASPASTTYSNTACPSTASGPPLHRNHHTNEVLSRRTPSFSQHPFVQSILHCILYKDSRPKVALSISHFVYTVSTTVSQRRQLRRPRQIWKIELYHHFTYLRHYF